MIPANGTKSNGQVQKAKPIPSGYLRWLLTTFTLPTALRCELLAELFRRDEPLIRDKSA